jgi:hypothetical protein
VIVVDDDAIYSKSIIDQLYTAQRREPTYVHTRGMGVMDLKTGQVMEGVVDAADDNGPVSCEYFIASLGMSFNLRFFQDQDLATFVLKCTDLYAESFFGDDLIVSNYFALKKIPIVFVPSRKNKDKSLGVRYTDASTTTDALEKGANGQCCATKCLYTNIMLSLKKQNFWFIKEQDEFETTEEEKNLENNQKRKKNEPTAVDKKKQKKTLGFLSTGADN